VTDVPQIAAIVLAVCFAWAGFTKLLGPRRWRASLRAYSSPAVMRIAVPGVPTAELAVAALLIVNARAGAAAATILLGVFTAALVHARERTGDRLPCACFGATRERDWRALAARNAGLGAAAVIAFAGGRPVGADALPIILAAAGLALAGWTAVATRAAFRR
jgi:hypothetical protein